MSAPDTAPYETLARNLERELELIGQGSLDGLAALHAERATLLKGLPAIPPAAARPALQRAALLNRRVEIEILQHQEALIVESANVERVERTARGYAPPVEPNRHVQATA